MEENQHTFTGRVAGLIILRAPEFGIRARLNCEERGGSRFIVAVEGDVARDFIARYRGGDKVTVRGTYDPRPSPAAANTPWVPRFLVRAVQVAQDTRLAA